MTYQEALKAYRERFDGDSFPLMLVQDMTDDEVRQKIEKCLRDGRPYEPSDGARY